VNPVHLERLRDLLEPIEPPACCRRRVESLDEALTSFRELVDAVARAHRLGVPVRDHAQELLGAFGDLRSEREELELACAHAGNAGRTHWTAGEKKTTHAGGPG